MTTADTPANDPIGKLVDAAPPLSEAQKVRLAALLWPPTGTLAAIRRSPAAGRDAA